MSSKKKPKINWGAVGAIAAIIAIPCTLFFPEARRFVGLEKPAAVTAPLTASKPEVTPPQKVASSTPTPEQRPQRSHSSHRAGVPTAPQQPTGNGNGSIGGGITQGAGSIAQIGGSGNTATVVNNGPRRLVLSEQQQSGLASHLSGLQGESVEIDVSSATPETSKFADALISSLNLAGIKAKRNDGMFIGGCANYPGVSFMAGIHRMKLVQAIWSGLVDVKAVDRSESIPGCSRSGEPDELHIRIFAP